MSARRYPCKRKGCHGLRETRQILCAECWALVPQILRKGYLGARRRLTRLAKIASQHIMIALAARQPAEPNGPAAKAARARAITATESYARTAAQMGERIDQEAAE